MANDLNHQIEYKRKKIEDKKSKENDESQVKIIYKLF